MSQAAASLNLAQSAVSASIAALESRYGVKLFDRIGRGIALTETGKMFLIEARAVLARVAAAQLMLAELGGLKRGSLHVQASQTISSNWLPRHLATFRRSYPDIDIRLSIGNTAQVAQAVHEGVVELGFVEGAVEDAILTSQRVARDQLLVVVGPEHAWASRADMTPAELADGEWVLREAGSGTRSVFEDALRAFGVAASQLRVVLELPSNEAVRTAVEAGLGATAISASVAAPSLEAGLLAQVNFPLPERDFHVLRHRERILSRAAGALLAMMGVTPAAPAP